MAVTKDDVLIKLFLEEEDALKALDAAIAKAETFQQEISEITRFADEMGKKFGVSAQKIIDAFKAIGPEASKNLSNLYPNLISQELLQSSSGAVLPKTGVRLSAAAIEVSNAEALAKAEARRLAAEEKINAKIRERQTVYQQELAGLEAQLKVLKLQADKVKAITQEARVIAKQEKISPVAALNKMTANLAAMGVSSRTIRKTFIELSNEEQKQLSLSEKRRNVLAGIVNLRQQEILAIKGQGTYLQQVANAQKLIEQLVKQTGSNANQVASELKTSFGFADEVVGTALNNITAKTKGFAGIMKDVFGNVRSYMSTAFGTTMAIALFQAQAMVSQFVTESTKKLRDFEKNLRELRLAEKLMSQAGIEISNKQLDEIVSKIEQTYIGFTRLDAMDLVGEVALITKNIKGMNAERLEMLAMSVAYMKTIDSSLEAAKVLNAVIDKKDMALTKFGVNFDDVLVKAKALEIFGDVGREFSDAEKIAAVIELVFEQTAANAEDLRESIAGTNQEIDQLSVKASSQLQENVGRFFRDVEVKSKSMFLSIAGILGEIADAIKLLIGTTLAGISLAFGVLFGPSIFKQLQLLLTGQVDEWKRLWQDFFVWWYITWAETLDKWLSDSTWVGQELKKLIGIPEMRELTGKNVVPETPTADKPPIPPIIPPISEEENKADKIRDILSSLAEALDQFGDRARKAQEDFNLMWNEISGRAWEDYRRDIWEINRDINEKIAEENRRQRARELDAEARFLERLRQLREKFLFSLEDALRERDARQVIRLTKQYEMDKAALIREEELRKKRDAEETQQKLRDLEAERAKRLEQLNYEFETKRKREEEDYKISMQRLKEELDDKLQAIANNIAEQLGLNEQGAKAVYDVLSKFYGPRGGIDSLVNYTYENMIRKSDYAYKRIVEIYEKFKVINSDLNNAQPPAPTTPSGPRPRKGGIEKRRTPSKKMSEGGAIIANTATDIRFGEAGGEAMFVPLNKLATMFAPSIEHTPRMGSGKIDVRVTISPDLRAEIVQSSIDEFAGALEIVQRER